MGIHAQYYEKATMRQLRKLLTTRQAWFEAYLEELARLDGYGDLPRPLVQLCALIGREPIRISELAVSLGTSRQWVTRLAHDGVGRDILEMVPDPTDRRAMMIGFSESGWQVVRKAVVRMQQIEDDLAERLGEQTLAQLAEILALDWGDPAPQPARRQRKERCVTSATVSASTPIVTS
jgi:DNA-binding MarR family transcriptional regulator